MQLTIAKSGDAAGASSDRKYACNTVQIMNFNINISNADGTPIYQQISDQIKTMILEEKLKEGDMLPSMRNLALELRISFMTTKRAYEELERDGFIESYTGKGSFVKAQTIELFREAQMKKVEELLFAASDKARKCGLSIDDLHQMLDLVNGGEYSDCI